ncbi:Armadillo-type fold domain containing protein [Purpureocillium lavendulum]|uniref:RING-type E3 ubiquitin transferase n=1 Tax=Purpureocillium lavendulum TaxID=1247861 RepID=A0AB34FN77_9HYPO|nr:Armadillo-type fold domain containing protein [Purpureocillium lavendulum]
MISDEPGDPSPGQPVRPIWDPENTRRLISFLASLLLLSLILAACAYSSVRGATEIDDPEDPDDEASSSSAYSETTEISLLDATVPSVPYKSIETNPKYKRSGGYSTMTEAISICAICKEFFQDNDEVRPLPCGHVYHSNCLIPWHLNQNHTCPLCKYRYLEEDTEQGGRSWS